MAKVTIEKLGDAELEKRGVQSWPTWSKEVSRFDWSYGDTEECYLLEGEVVVETDEGEFHFQAGDFVTFQAGLSCVWDIKKAVNKHYNFK